MSVLHRHPRTPEAPGYPTSATALLIAAAGTAQPTMVVAVTGTVRPQRRSRRDH